MPAEPQARELWFTAPRRVELRHAAPRARGPGEVLARALASGVSQGTELLLYRGEAPEPFDPSLDPSGTPVYPRRYGYAWVGEIVSGVRVGARVVALAPHGDLAILDGRALRVVSEHIPATRAVLFANLETAITCVWDTQASIGDEVLVIGAGVVGLLVTWILGKIGTKVRVAEPTEKRRALAERLGARAAIAFDHGAVDVVVEASGDPAALDRAIAVAGPDAKIVVASFYGTRRAPIALGSEFHRRRLTLSASQVSSIPPSRAPRWSFERRFELVRELLDDPVLDTLVDDVVPFAEAPKVYARLDSEPHRHVQTVFNYA